MEDMNLNNHAVTIQGVTKRFVNVLAVDNITLSIPKGSIYGFLGPNGAGKTTAIRMMMNIILPDEGEIRMLGEKVSEETLNRIGYLPEERGLYPKMKVADIVAYFATIKGYPKAKIREQTHNWIEKLGLADWERRKVSELSKGMQQKVQFIVTVIHEPELIILDEPFSGLDPVNVELLKDIILKLKQEGKTIIFSTHIMETAEKLCDYIFLINKGRNVLNGTLAEVKATGGDSSIILEYDGDGSFIKDLSFVARSNDFGKYIEIGLVAEAEPQELLKAVVDKITVRRFEVRELSLNEIFIRKVKEQNA